MAAKSVIVKAAFELQSLRVFEKRSKVHGNNHLSWEYYLSIKALHLITPTTARDVLQISQ